MDLYPVCLKLDKKKACVIGGGNVALRKVKTLRKSTPDITVVSPDLCKQLQALHKQGKIKYKRSEYDKKLIKDAFLIIAATDDEKVNARVVSDADVLGKLVNVVDVPHQCNFYLPSVINKKGLLLAVSTQGAFPGLSKKIRQNAQKMVEKYAVSLKVLAKIRNQVIRQYQDKPEKKVLLDNLLEDNVLKKINEKKISDIKGLKKCLKIK